MAQQVVVIGAGMGGLSAAIHARLSGAEVTVLEARNEVGGKAAEVRISGYRLDPGPSIIILPQIYEDVFRRAGRSPEEYIKFSRLDPISRVFFEGEQPFDLPGDRSDCIRAVKRLSAKDARSLETIFQRFDGISDLVFETVFARPIQSWWQFCSPSFIRMGIAMRLRGNYRQQVDEWFESQIMRAFFYGFPSYSGQGLDGTGASALFIPYFMLTSGVYFPVGGVAAIPMAFERLANELGVTFRLGDAVAKVDTDGNQVTQVRTQSGEIYIADRFIANVDRFTFGSLLGREVDVAPSFSYFTMHAGVPRRIQGLSHHNLLIPRDFVDSFDDLYKKRIFPRHPIVYVNDTTMNDPEAAPTGSTNLFSVVTCPAMESHLDWEFEKLRAETATTDTLARFGIQLDDAEFCRIQTPQTFADRDKNFKGSLYGVDETFRPFKGMMPFPNHDPQYQNLRYCGGSVQPGAGLPMVTLSGRFAAES